MAGTPNRRLSVLLPTIDRRPSLELAIRSVLDHSYPDLELVIADDGSTGATRAVIDRHRDDPRVRVVEHRGPKLPITANWNAALDASVGDYLLLLGDDDALLPGSIDRLVELLAEHREPDVLSYGGYRFAPVGTVPGLEHALCGEIGLEPDFPTPGGELPAEERLGIVRDFFSFKERFPPGEMPLVLVSRRAANRLPAGLFRPPFPDFYAVGALLLTVARWVHVREALAVVTISPNSVAGRFYRNRRDEALSYIGGSDTFPNALPGNAFVNATCRWLLTLQEDFPAQLGSLSIDRSQYVARQLWASLRQRSTGQISRGELLRRLTAVSFRDWLRLARALLRRENLGYVVSALPHLGQLERRTLTRTMSPVPNAPTVPQFLARVGSS